MLSEFDWTQLPTDYLIAVRIDCVKVFTTVSLLVGIDSKEYMRYLLDL